MPLLDDSSFNEHRAPDFPALLRQWREKPEAHLLDGVARSDLAIRVALWVAARFWWPAVEQAPTDFCEFCKRAGVRGRLPVLRLVRLLCGGALDRPRVSEFGSAILFWAARPDASIEEAAKTDLTKEIWRRKPPTKFVAMPPATKALIEQACGGGPLDDPFPLDRPDGYDGHTEAPPRRVVLNPMFGNGELMQVARRAIRECRDGALDVAAIIVPVGPAVAELAAAGAAFIDLGRVPWLDPVTGDARPDPQPIVAAILRPAPAADGSSDAPPKAVDRPTGDTNLQLETELATLRDQIAERDAAEAELHAEIAALRGDLAAVTAERDDVRKKLDDAPNLGEPLFSGTGKRPDKIDKIFVKKVEPVMRAAFDPHLSIGETMANLRAWHRICHGLSPIELYGEAFDDAYLLIQYMKDRMNIEFTRAEHAEQNCTRLRAEIERLKAARRRTVKEKGG